MCPPLGKPSSFFNLRLIWLQKTVNFHSSLCHAYCMTLRLWCSFGTHEKRPIDKKFPYPLEPVQYIQASCSWKIFWIFKILIRKFWKVSDTFLIDMSQLLFTCSQSTMETPVRVWNLVKVKNKDTRVTSWTANS